ncbi:class I SAM-dependent methyltransferase [Candidatus Parcubacteria bacterium]|nr:MAG: class I SAM-dependent methyltransferase [Candidatus Parcubacteria bacterium]
MQEDVNITAGWETVTCDFCGSERASLFIDDLSDTTNFTEGKFTLVECNECGLIYLNPRPSFKILGKYYNDDYYEKETGKRFNSSAESILDALRSLRVNYIRRYRRQGEILDIGCGRGDLLARMKKMGWGTCGIQISENSISAAKINYGLNILYGDFVDLDLGSRQFDVVSFFYVLEHVHRPKAYLEKARNLLKPGGVIIVSIPNGDSLQAKFFRGKWLILEPPRHLYLFKAKAFTPILRELKLEILASNSFAWDMNPFSLLQSLMNLFIFPQNAFFSVLKHKRVKNRYKSPALTTFTSCLAAVTLAPLTIVLSIFLSLAASGDIITYVLRKKNDR